ncbi:hypothetical protein [Micromonospora aurantiaca (nom. illeg.)]|uniref:hypothetical protein n=1 Tax=Micromonospora aurantiaca (nom. illeg.) TaxID=47850 RepID=UPI0033CB5505
MPVVPETKATWTNGVDPLNSTNLHAYVRDPIRFLMHKPSAVLRQSTAQSLTSATWVPLTMGTEDLDDDPDGIGGHSTVSNTSRYTARYPGWYWLGGGVTVTANANGTRGCRWAVNGTPVNGGSVVLPATSSGGTRVPARAHLVFLFEGDYVELQGTQSSGGSLNTIINGEEQASMCIAWDRLAA